MKPVIPNATVERLPRYLRALEQLPRHQTTVSSTDVARLSGVNSAKVRKDLSFLGSYGVRGVGYNILDLAGQIRRELGITEDRRIIVVGVGNLGSALAAYGGFENRGFEIVGLYDADPAKIGTTIQEHVVRPVSELTADVETGEVTVAIIATPATVAQSVADLLVESGVPAILNFAPAMLKVPEGVAVRQVDLATELQILSFYMGADHSAAG